MVEGEAQDVVGPHAETEEMGLVDVQRVEHAEHVRDRDVLPVGFGFIRHVRGRVATCVKGYAAVTVSEMIDLFAPHTMVAAELVHEDHRRATAFFLDPEIYAIDFK